MTDTPTDTAPEAITQADREAVADYLGCPMIRAGSHDHHPLVAAFARHRRLTSHSAGEGLREALAPWVDHHGPLPDFDSPFACVFDSGVQHTVELLAKELKVDDWTPCDGTEEYDGDLGGTLMNIVCAAMPEDAHGERMWPHEVRALLTPPSDAGSTTRSGGEGVRSSRGEQERLEDAIAAGYAAWTDGDSDKGMSATIAEYVAALATTPSPDASPDSGEAEKLVHLIDEAADPYTFWGDDDGTGMVVTQHRYYAWGDDCIIAIGQRNAPNEWDDHAFDGRCAALEAALATTPLPDASPDSGEAEEAFRDKVRDLISEMQMGDASEYETLDAICALAASPASLSGGAEEGGQDRKFAFRNGQFVNRVSGEPIPADEPIIIFRARDWHALPLLREYLSMADDEHHQRAIRDRMAEFGAFARAHPERMKEPGITRAIRLNDDAPSPEAPANRQEAGEVEDTALLNMLRDECWDLRCFDVPTGGGDADVAWRVIGHWEADPRKRTIADGWSNEPREALRQARATLTSPKDVKGDGA